MRGLLTHNPINPQVKTLRISLLRSVFTVGVLCKFFDFDTIIPAAPGVSGIHVLALIEGIGPPCDLTPLEV